MKNDRRILITTVAITVTMLISFSMSVLAIDRSNLSPQDLKEQGTEVVETLSGSIETVIDLQAQPLH